MQNKPSQCRIALCAFGILIGGLGFSISLLFTARLTDPRLPIGAGCFFGLLALISIKVLPDDEIEEESGQLNKPMPLWDGPSRLVVVFENVDDSSKQGIILTNADTGAQIVLYKIGDGTFRSKAQIKHDVLGEMRKEAKVVMEDLNKSEGEAKRALDERYPD